MIVSGVGEGRQRLIDWYTLVELTLKKRYEYIEVTKASNSRGRFLKILHHFPIRDPHLT